MTSSGTDPATLATLLADVASIKAVTLWQPWATFVAIGAKRWETRSWPTDHRGLLAIHAAKRFPDDVRALCVPGPGIASSTRSVFFDALRRAGIHGPRLERGHYTVGELPLGAVVAVVNLIDVVRIGPTRRRTQRRQLLADDIPADEHPFGDFTPGRYVWQFEDVTPLPRPIPARGAQLLWDWQLPADLVGTIARRRAGEAR
jgi:hypothetical protein